MATKKTPEELRMIKSIIERLEELGLGEPTITMLKIRYIKLLKEAQ